jgi:hypothetical protein
MHTKLLVQQLCQVVIKELRMLKSENVSKYIMMYLMPDMENTVTK